jgi:hypothetical protein
MVNLGKPDKEASYFRPRSSAITQLAFLLLFVSSVLSVVTFPLASGLRC